MSLGCFLILPSTAVVPIVTLIWSIPRSLVKQLQMLVRGILPGSLGKLCYSGEFMEFAERTL